MNNNRPNNNNNARKGGAERKNQSTAVNDENKQPSQSAGKNGVKRAGGREEAVRDVVSSTATKKVPKPRRSSCV